MKIKKILFLAVFLVAFYMNGQVNLKEDRDVFSVFYTPELKKDNLFSYQKTSISLSLQPLTFNRFTFYSTLGLAYHQFSYKNEVPVFSEEMEKFYATRYTLLANYILSKNWSLNAVAMPRIVSNFTNGINTNNVDINGVIFVEKKFNSKKSNRYFKLTVGVGYLTLAGRNTVNPVVNFIGKVNDHVSFVLGIPNTYIKYDFNKRHSLRLMGELNGFDAHINKTLFVDPSKAKKIDKAIFTEASAGLEYNYWFTKSIGILIRGTHTLFSEYKLEDVDENTLFDFNSSLKPYVSIGIKLNPFR